MDDYISRQVAIEAICKVCSIVGDYHKCDGYPETSTWCEEITALRAILSADVQPVRHERWTKIDVSGLASCGCGYITDRYSVFNYCPHCGARMDEVT